MAVSYGTVIGNRTSGKARFLNRKLTVSRYQYSWELLAQFEANIQVLIFIASGASIKTRT